MPSLVIDGRKTDLGGGFVVRRLLPFRERRMVGPFIFFDHAGPLRLPPDQFRKADVRPHPHINLATISYLFDGRITHRDSLGFKQVIRPGEVNWMTAGRGITHSERFDDAAALAESGFEMIQIWVALPTADEECAPSFEHYDTEQLPVATDKGVRTRLVAGAAFGLQSAVKTRSPLFYVHAELQPGARLGLPRGYPERAAYVVRGAVTVGGGRYADGRMLVFDPKADPVITAEEAATVMLIGGEPVGERFIWWNFVSSRKERIEEAKEDWKAGRFALPPDDNAEFIPLPEPRETQPPAEPLS
ncbi:MAG: pirin family protein [Rhodospirillales bacterium]|nr:pirin family protein [Rhodospirillales bacterium]